MKPFPYQETGARFLAARRRGGLLDGCRVGKTIQGVMACDLVAPKNALITCPGMARAGWVRTFEAASLLDLPVNVIMNTSQAVDPEGVNIVSMDGTRSGELFPQLMKHRWDVLLADEPHFLKTPTAQRTKQVLSKHGLAGRSSRIWFLTATPLMKDPSDLWVMLRTIGSTKLTYEEFLDRYCKYFMGEFGPKVYAAQRVGELKKLIAPHFLRRMWDDVKHEVSDNPVDDPVWSDIELSADPLDPDHAAAIRNLAELERDRNVLRLVERWKRDEAVDFSSNSPMASLRNAVGAVKAPVLARELGRRLAKDWDKAVVFFHHKLAGDLLRKELERLGFHAVRVDGSVPDKRREALRQSFWSDRGVRVFVCQDNIARQAIDLSVANRLIFLEMDWVPDNNYQASMRIQGPLQTRAPHVYTASLKGSLDAGIAAVNKRRTKMFASILN